VCFGSVLVILYEKRKIKEKGLATGGKYRNDLEGFLSFQNTFASLPDSFYTFTQPTSLPNPYWISVSETAARLIEWSKRDFEKPEVLSVFVGNAVVPTSKPLAAVYSGHQFGQWAGQLGDGRALLLGDLPALESSLELQLKGAGPTPYSRRGDGRAVLRSSVREFLCSEAMAALGIPTTRALCLAGSKSPVYREKIETASVVTRMAPTFIRFGSFEHWYYKNDLEKVKILADHVITHFYPEFVQDQNPYRLLLTEVVRRTAELIAQWQCVGFMHGVMNTDNMSIVGLTLDYGPFGFMDGFDQGFICNHSDTGGRYAYTNQPHIGHWNCRAFAQTILHLIGEVEEVQAILSEYVPIFRAKFSARMKEKLGLQTSDPGDLNLIDSLLTILQESKVDYTLFFRKLGNLRRNDFESNRSIADLFADRLAFDEWSLLYRNRLSSENSDDFERKKAMDKVNPKYILRNHLAQIAIEKAEMDDFSEVDRLLKILENPFDEQEEYNSYAQIPPNWASDMTISCSS
jgi:serine/tyrosine/threonine adenylyltransferase